MIFQKQRLLYAFLPKENLSGWIKNKCTEIDKKRLPKILEKFENARQKLNSIFLAENGIAEKISVEEINNNFKEKMKTISEEQSFKNAYANQRIEFKMVEIDKLVLTQSGVFLDYVEELLKKFPKNPTEEELIDICFPLEKNPAEVSEKKINDFIYLYSSDSIDFRLLNIHHIEIGDIKMGKYYAANPAKALLITLGFGLPFVNVFSVGGRIILNNGMQRLYALRSLGVKFAPAVVKYSDKLPSSNVYSPEIILENPRPPLMKDFFDSDLTIDIMIKPKINNIKINIVPEVFDMDL